MRVRYLDGDISLVDGISKNKRLQEQHREDDPSHPARLFGEATEAEPEAVKQNQEALTLKKLDQESQDIELATKRRRVENYAADCYASLESHGIRMDDQNRKAVKDYVDSKM